MKRPRLIYFVAAWCCLPLLQQASHVARRASPYQAAGELVPALWGLLSFVVYGFAIWQTDGLIQLKRFHRWFAVVLSTWSSAVLVWTATIELRRPTVKFIPAIVVFSVLIAFNLLSAWYLSRALFESLRFSLWLSIGKSAHHLSRKRQLRRTQDEMRSMRS